MCAVLEREKNFDILYGSMVTRAIEVNRFWWAIFEIVLCVGYMRMKIMKRVKIARLG